MEIYLFVFFFKLPQPFRKNNKMISSELTAERWMKKRSMSHTTIRVSLTRQASISLRIYEKEVFTLRVGFLC